MLLVELFLVNPYLCLHFRLCVCLLAVRQQCVSCLQRLVPVHICIYIFFFTFSHFCRLSAFPLQSKINDETFVLWRITVNMFVNSVKKKIIKKNSAVNVSSPSESVTRHVVYETQNTAFLAAYRDSSAALARTRESWILTP